MAQFNTDIVLNTKVNQASLSKAVRSINQVTSLVRQLKPINLFAPGTGAGPDKIRTELESILKISKQINTGQTGKGGLASTFAGANDQAQAFLETLKNVNIKARDGSSKAKVAQFADAFVAADKQARKYEKTLSEVIRKARGLQPQAVRDVEVERRKQFIITEKEKRKQAKITADARIKEDKRAADAVRRNELKAQRDRDKRKRERSSKLNNLGAAIGFPLLFGGGVGSVGGGAIGAAFGGFGGSILGSALGGQLDALAAAALSTADAFGKLGATANGLVPKLGRGASNGFGGQAEFLIGEGRSSQVADILRARFDEVYGPGAVKEFEDLSKSSTDLKNVWTELGIQLQKLAAGPLKGIVETLKGIADRDKPANKEAFAAQAAYNKIRDRNRAVGSDVSKDDLAAEANALAQVNKVKGINLIGPELTDEITDRLQVTAAEEKLIELAKKEKSIQNEINVAKLAAASQALTARRDDLAALKAAVGITQTLADLDKTRAQLTAERARSIKDIKTILQLEKTEAEQAADLERQRIAQANAVALAERQIRQELRGLSIQEFQLQQQITNEKAKFNSLSATEKKQYDIKIALLEEQYQTAVDVLTVQEAVALEGKNEIEVRNEITKSFEKQKQLAYERVKAQTLEVYQAEILRQDRLQAITDQKELNKLTAKNAAIRAIDSNDPERTDSFSAAGLGFFADSALIEANVIRDSAAQLEEYNVQIAALQKRIKGLSESNFGGINDGRLSIKQEQLDKLTETRNLYEQLQPAIDAATIKQAQFNDALAAVTPGVNALVGGLQDVVAGTKTAEEAFADFLNTVADQLIQTAAVMIAQYIAIGLAKAFAGLGGTPGGGGIDSFGGGNPLGALIGSTPFPGLATGGTADGGQPYIVGERGPELFIPGVTGTVTNNDQFAAAYDAMSGSGGGSSTAFSENSDAIAVSNSYTRERTLERERNETSTSSGTMLIETQVINNVEYATVDQVDKAAAASAKQARAQVFSDMKNRPATRRQLGIS